MDPRYPLRAAATPDGLPGEMLGPITAPLAPAPAERFPVDGVVLPCPAGHALAAATVARMARRGFIACADVWMEVGEAVGVEAALAYVVRAEDGAAPYATGAAGPADASGVCRVLPEPFGPAWAVLTARALDGAALLRPPYPDSTPVWGTSAGGAPDGAAGGAAEDAADAPPDPLAADVARFLTAAQTRITELHPDNDFELDADAYDQVKTSVFEALTSGRLKQEYADGENRVTLASQSSDWGTW